MIIKVGFGGGCHWCTEAYFSALKGIIEVEQGWISSYNENFFFSEAVLVTFNTTIISLRTLIEIHLRTHSSISYHSMRKKYRSAVYFINEDEQVAIEKIIQDFQHDFGNKLITQTLPFKEFKQNSIESLNYYFQDPAKPFCTTYIDPKLKMLIKKFSQMVDESKLNHLK